MWNAELNRGDRRSIYGHDDEERSGGLVFCQPNGYYWSPNNIGLRVSELLRKAGLHGFSLHSLRHSHASVLLSTGTPLPVVSERLGHADQNITLGVYSHALPADVRAAAEAWHNALAKVIAEERAHKRAPKTPKKPAYVDSSVNYRVVRPAKSGKI